MAKQTQPQPKLEVRVTATFTCAACDRTFEKGRPDEEAMAEAELVWAGHDLRDAAVVCDTCFKAMFWTAGNG